MRRIRLRLGRPGDGRDRLLTLLPRGSSGVEIGVWKGDFSARVLARVRPTELHLIDPWRFEGDPRYREAWYGGSQARDQSEMDAIHASVEQRFARQIRTGVVTIHRTTSVQAAESFEDGSLDWVYIDGNHFYEFVRMDLNAFWPKLRPGGLLTGDDYVTGQWWEGGVIRAVDEFVEERRLERTGFIGTQFILRRPVR